MSKIAGFFCKKFLGAMNRVPGINAQDLVPAADWNRVKYTCDEIFR